VLYSHILSAIPAWALRDDATACVTPMAPYLRTCVLTPVLPPERDEQPTAEDVITAQVEKWS